MNTHEIDFIMCVNDMQYCEECIRYIRNLNIPENYSIDIISIQNADSMAQGYNAGMREGNGKYKVYLHQDTFIRNRNFLYDILEIFKSDASIGMIGVVGAVRLPTDAYCYYQVDVGVVSVYSGLYTELAVHDHQLYQDEKRPYISVKAIDGLIMITQEDIPWREDILDGWDFYDVSQSLEMYRHGYQVVVPYQKEGWCHHDSGLTKLQRYDFYRHRMIKEYPEYFKENPDAADMDVSRLSWYLKIRLMMINLIEAGAYDELCVVIRDKLQGVFFDDTIIREIIKLMEIYVLEKQKNEFSEWWSLRNWEQIYAQYTQLRFILLRMKFQQSREGELEELLMSGKVTVEAVRVISARIFTGSTF